MKFKIILFCLINVLNSDSKINFGQDPLCEHSTDSSVKSKGIKMILSFPCDWKEMETKSSDEVFKFAKKDNEAKVMTSASVDISDLPPGLNSSQQKQLLEPEGLKTLSEGSGEMESNKPLAINNVAGGQIIRKDEVHNYYKIRNYFIYKNKLIAISYFLISASPVKVKDYFDAFDLLLNKTKFN